MRKNLSLLLVLLVLTCFTGVVSAAESTFSDVPANHWAYGAVKQLAKAGIIEGYKDGTFRGQGTITRYEMAIITANAMTKLSNASAEDKALVEKMAAEFSSELKALNIRVATLENKVGNIKFSGEVRERYEYNKDQDNKIYTRFRLKMLAPLTDSLVFVGRIESENTAGNGPAGNGYNGSQLVNVNQAFITGKALGFDTILFGRIPLYLGQGLLADSETVITPSAGPDGLVLSTGNKLKVLYAVGKAGFSDVNDFTLNLQAGNLTYLMSKNLTLTSTYLADKNNAFYKSSSAGFSYKGIENFTLTSEFGKNDSDLAKASNNNSSAKGWFVRAKYRGANGLVEKSSGFWVGYRQADPAFDALTLGSAGGVDTTHLRKDFTGTTTSMSNVKGFDFGVEFTVFKNAILSFQMDNFKDRKGSNDAKSFMSTLNYSF